MSAVDEVSIVGCVASWVDWYCCWWFGGVEADSDSAGLLLSSLQCDSPLDVDSDSDSPVEEVFSVEESVLISSWRSPWVGDFSAGISESDLSGMWRLLLGGCF